MSLVSMIRGYYSSGDTGSCQEFWHTEPPEERGPFWGGIHRLFSADNYFESFVEHAFHALNTRLNVTIH